MHETIDITCSATAQVIANFALQHFKAACLFQKQVEAIEHSHRDQEFGAFFEIIRSYCSGTILSSVAALEALINELFNSPTSRLYQLKDNPDRVDFPQNKNPEILKKYQKALRLLEKNSIDEDGSIFCEAKYLIFLRNHLVHFKPVYDEKHEHVKLKNFLGGKFALSPFPDKGADFFTMKCMSAGCADWAISTTKSFIEEFAAVSELDSKKLKAFKR